MLSLTVIGIPRSGVSSSNSWIVFLPDCIRSSTARASSKAASKRFSTIAFNSGFTSLHLSMYASTNVSLLS